MQVQALVDFCQVLWTTLKALVSPLILLRAVFDAFFHCLIKGGYRGLCVRLIDPCYRGTNNHLRRRSFSASTNGRRNSKKAFLRARVSLMAEKSGSFLKPAGVFASERGWLLMFCTIRV